MTSRTLTTKLLVILSYKQENGTTMDAVIPLDGK
ncbi:DNA-directed RNA polymerase, partial [Listeria monocytogenes]|nr:DNA-directed RNA polymerase [Listeria monocytogenes]